MEAFFLSEAALWPSWRGGVCGVDTRWKTPDGIHLHKEMDFQQTVLLWSEQTSFIAKKKKSRRQMFLKYREQNEYTGDKLKNISKGIV